MTDAFADDDVPITDIDKPPRINRATFAGAGDDGYIAPGESAPKDQAGRAHPADLEVVCAASFEGVDVPRQKWLVRDLIPAANITILGGDGGVGKSLLALQLCVAVATGTEWIGTMPEPGVAMFLSAEDEIEELHRRLAAMTPDLGSLRDLHLVPLAGKDAVLAAPAGREGLLMPTSLFESVKNAVKDLRPALLVLDTLADLFGGDEIKRAHARQFIALLRGLALEYGTAIVLLTHPSLEGMRSGSGSSGNTGWNNSVRSRLYLAHRKNADGSVDDGDVRQLSTKKANRAAVNEPINLRYERGKFVLEGAGIDAREFGREAATTFLTLLKQFDRESRRVSPNPRGDYAPRIFAAHPNSNGISERHFATAMNQLLEQERIKIEMTGPPTKLRPHLVLAGQFSAPPTDREAE